MKGITTIILLILSNTFMTIAWYGHLKFSEMKGFAKLSLPFVGTFFSYAIKSYAGSYYFNNIHNIYSCIFQNRNFEN